MGIEYFCEEYLKGETGLKRTEFNTEGSVTSEYISEEAEIGSDVILTLDYRLQKISYEILKQKIEALKAGKTGDGVRPQETRWSSYNCGCKYR